MAESLLEMGQLLDERKSEERINLLPGDGVDEFVAWTELSTEKGNFYKLAFTVISSNEGDQNKVGETYTKLFTKPFKELKPTWKLQSTIREVSDLGLALIAGFREMDGEARWTAIQELIADNTKAAGVKVNRHAFTKPGKDFVNVKYTAI